MTQIHFLRASLLTTIAFFSTLGWSANFQSLCGQLKELHFYENPLHRVQAFVLLDHIKIENKSDPFWLQKLSLTDPKIVFNISKAVSKSSIQNSKQLQKDLKELKFHWDRYVGSEEAFNPFEEDFRVCITADLDRLNERRELPVVFKLDDILEDGHSIIDLIDVDLH